MRPIIESFCALAGVLFFSAAVCAAENPMDIHARADKARVNGNASPHMVKCLGGVLNRDTATNYIALGDYPAAAPAPTSRRHATICGDSIPPFLRWVQYRSGFISRSR